MDYLPDGFDELIIDKNYWRMKDMKVGDNRLRIVQKPIAGWIDWKDNKPHRFRHNEKPATPFDSTKPIRAFWTLYVWDYNRESLFVLEITQSSVLKSLVHFARDEEWGDFTKYDIKLIREGTGKDTRWQVSPIPHKPMSEKILKALSDNPVNLEALFYGGDPWTDFKLSGKAPAPSIDRISQTEADELDAIIGPDQVYRETILNFLSKNYGVDSLSKMPTDLYDKVKQRALTNKQEREKKAQEAFELFGESFQIGAAVV